MMPVTFHFSIPSFMSQPMLPSNAADKREIQTSGWAAVLLHLAWSCNMQDKPGTCASSSIEGTQPTLQHHPSLIYASLIYATHTSTRTCTEKLLHSSNSTQQMLNSAFIQQHVFSWSHAM
jgi:hypothetical protein